MKESWKSAGWGAAAIVLLTMVVYFPVMSGGFVFDDGIHITDNPMIQAKDGLYRIWFTTEQLDFYPLTWSLWWLEWRLWGNSPAGYHVVNVVVHALASVLVWRVLRGLRVRGAWLAGLLFAVHPVNAASVAWISEQKNTISLFFGAITVLLYLKFDQTARWRWYLLSLAAFLLALLGKTAVVTLPFVLPGCVWWLHGRVRPKDWLYSAPFFVLSLICGLATVWFHERTLQGVTGQTDDFFQRLPGAGWATWFYLCRTVLPFNLNVIYPDWNLKGLGGASYLPGLGLLGCLIFFWWKRRLRWGRSSLFGVGYFLAMLLPVLGFIDNPEGFATFSRVADHWQYHSIIGIIALAVAAGAAMCEWAGLPGRFVSRIAGAGALAMLGVLTWNRANIYKDAEALWRDTIAKNPAAWMAHYNLGVALNDRGRYAESIPEYQITLRYRPGHVKTHYNLANALTIEGRLEEAVAEYQAALQLTPNDASLHNNLGNALALQGKMDGAIEEYQTALRVNPDLWDTRYNLARILRARGRLTEAVAEYQTVTRLKPDFLEARHHLADALVALERMPEALAEYRDILRRNPDWPPTLGRLAWLLATHKDATVRNAAEAVSLAERLCKLTAYRQAESLDVLAAAYAEAGRFAEAEQAAQNALTMAEVARQSDLARQIQNRLKLYQSRNPYHQ